MAGKQPFDKEFADTLFNYCEGKIFWKVGNLKGREAGYVHNNGYRYINYKRSMILAHRLVWLLCKGFWPTELIDHTNGNRSDNRVENLRECNHSQNNANRPLSKGVNKFKGVYYEARRRKWQAYLVKDGKKKFLGRYNTQEEAALAYNTAAEIFHGEFAAINKVE